MNNFIVMIWIFVLCFSHIGLCRSVRFLKLRVKQLEEKDKK